jgi:hypothetical protein
MEVWARGLCRHPAKVIGPPGPREFESLHFRHNYNNMSNFSFDAKGRELFPSEHKLVELLEERYANYDAETDPFKQTAEHREYVRNCIRRGIEPETQFYKRFKAG